MALLSFFKKKPSKHKKELINKDDNEELKSLDDKETSENDLINRKYSLSEIITTCVLHVYFLNHQYCLQLNKKPY